MTVTRKSIIRVLTKNGFVHVRTRSSSHQKYSKKCIDGESKTTILTNEKDYHHRTLIQVSKQTGIPLEDFVKDSGSRKFKNGNGNVFGLLGDIRSFNTE